MSLTSNATRRIHPQKFALWAGIAGMIMLFTALTSAYIVRRGAGNWFEVPIPMAFYYSTALILSSSLTIYGALVAFKDGKKQIYKALLAISFVLAMGFMASQYMGWMYLKDIGLGIHKQANASVSFVYLLTYLHAAHVLGGIAALSVALIHGFGLPFKVTPKRIHRLDLTATYWHFVDVLWIYLLLFFWLQR